jgi:hypothetical protein
VRRWFRMEIRERLLRIAEKLERNVTRSDVALYSVMLGESAYQINFIKQRTPNTTRTEIWFLKDEAILAVINQSVDPRSSVAEFEELLYILSDDKTFHSVLNSMTVIIPRPLSDEIIAKMKEGEKEKKRKEAVVRLIEMRNDCRLLYRYFGDEKYAKRIERIEKRLFS